MADPLKRAVYISDGQTIPVSHTMTVKKTEGFDMYFFADNYSITLSAKPRKVIDQETIDTRAVYLFDAGGRSIDTRCMVFIKVENKTPPGFNH